MVREGSADPIADLPRMAILDNGVDPEWVRDAEGMAVGPQTGADACQAEALMGGHTVEDSLSNRGPAEGHPSQASGAVAYRAGVEQASPHPAADLHFGLQTTAPGVVFVDHSSERRSVTSVWGHTFPFPWGEVVSSSAWANIMPTTASVVMDKAVGCYAYGNMFCWL